MEVSRGKLIVTSAGTHFEAKHDAGAVQRSYRGGRLPLT